jgi:hypothetical protein
MPWRAVQKNLSLGMDVYRAMLGVAPRIALVNEQAWSGGLVPLYLESGYQAVVMDWDDPAAHHPEWNRHWRYHPQKAEGTDGTTIGLLWSNTIAFQKLQRLAHRDISLDEYVAFISGHCGPVDRVLAVYTNDAECFDFRPGRFATEETIAQGEWETVRAGLMALREKGVALVLPSIALTSGGGANAGHLLKLEAPSNPVPVKKQPKYNLTRWSSSGRDDLWANTMCHRALQAMTDNTAPDDWRALLRLWSSDFRTHITEQRWHGFAKDLTDFVHDLEGKRAHHSGQARPSSPSAKSTVSDGERYITVETPAMTLTLDKRRGMAITSMARRDEPALIGGLAHGEIDDISLSADWYTGNMVFEGPGEPKVTDLERCTPAIVQRPDGSIILSARIKTPLGEIAKSLTIPPDTARVETELTFHWTSWGKGSLRLGHVTLKADAFDLPHLAYRTHSGGREMERFGLFGQDVDLGAAVSFLISCRSGIGMTEGLLQIDDGQRSAQLSADMATAAVIGLVEHRTLHGQTFCRMMLSALEMDDTRKPAPSSSSRTVRYAITLGP